MNKMQFLLNTNIHPSSVMPAVAAALSSQAELDGGAGGLFAVDFRLRFCLCAARHCPPAIPGISRSGALGRGRRVRHHRASAGGGERGLLRLCPLRRGQGRIRAAPPALLGAVLGGSRGRRGRRARDGRKIRPFAARHRRMVVRDQGRGGLPQHHDAAAAAGPRFLLSLARRTCGELLCPLPERRRFGLVHHGRTRHRQDLAAAPFHLPEPG